jgi:hypothetical protein
MPLNGQGGPCFSGGGRNPARGICHIDIVDSLSFNQEDEMAADNNIVRVRLFHDNYPVIKCRANYLGALGMQVESGPLFYQKGTELEVELTLEQQQLQCRVPVIVTRKEYNNLGLTFLNHDMQTNRCLLEIILAFNNRETVMLC